MRGLCYLRGWGNGDRKWGHSPFPRKRGMSPFPVPISPIEASYFGISDRNSRRSAPFSRNTPRITLFTIFDALSFTPRQCMQK